MELVYFHFTTGTQIGYEIWGFHGGECSDVDLRLHDV